MRSKGRKIGYTSGSFKLYRRFRERMPTKLQRGGKIKNMNVQEIMNWIIWGNDKSKWEPNPEKYQHLSRQDDIYSQEPIEDEEMLEGDRVLSASETNKINERDYPHK